MSSFKVLTSQNVQHRSRCSDCINYLWIPKALLKKKNNWQELFPAPLLLWGFSSIQLSSKRQGEQIWPDNAAQSQLAAQLNGHNGALASLGACRWCLATRGRVTALLVPSPKTKWRKKMSFLHKGEVKEFDRLFRKATGWNEWTLSRGQIAWRWSWRTGPSE